MGSAPICEKGNPVPWTGFPFLVRSVGLEPTRDNPHAPQTCLYANFSMTANMIFIILLLFRIVNYYPALAPIALNNQREILYHFRGRLVNTKFPVF